MMAIGNKGYHFRHSSALVRAYEVEQENGAMSEQHRRQLDEHGYVLLPVVIDNTLVNKLAAHIETLFKSEGDLAGSEFKQEPGARRLANLVGKGAVFWDLLTHRDVLPLVEHVLSDSVKLSSLNARSADPRRTDPQPLHCDMGALPDQLGDWVCNVVWMLDDFTPDNGPLRVVPGSHRWNQLPQDVHNDPVSDHEQQVILTGSAGSVIVMNAHLWHGGMANHTAKPRTAVHAFYCRRDKPQQQYQRLLLPDDVIATLPPKLRELLAIDDPLNDQLARLQVQQSGFLK